MLWVAYACGRPPFHIPASNAKLIPWGHETLVSCIESDPGVAGVARRMGASRQTVSKWLRRSRSGEGSPTKAAARAGIRGPRRQDGTTSYLAIRCLERLRGTAASNSIHLVAPT